MGGGGGGGLKIAYNLNFGPLIAYNEIFAKSIKFT